MRKEQLAEEHPAKPNPGPTPTIHYSPPGFLNNWYWR